MRVAWAYISPIMTLNVSCSSIDLYMPLPPRSMLSPFQAALITVTTTKKRGSKDMKIIIVLVSVQYTEEERRIDEKDHHTVHRRHNAKCLFRANQQLLRLLLVGSIESWRSRCRTNKKPSTSHLHGGLIYYFELCCELHMGTEGVQNNRIY